MAMPLYFVTAIVKGSRHQEIGVSSQGRAGSMLGITKAPANWIVYLIMIVCSIDRLCRVYLVKSQHPTGQKGIRWRAALPLTPDPRYPLLPEALLSAPLVFSHSNKGSLCAPVLATHPVCVHDPFTTTRGERGYLSPTPCPRQHCATQKELRD